MYAKAIGKKMIEIGRIAYDTTHILGQGAFARVHQGTFRGENGERIKVAVKRLMQGNFNTDEREVKALERLKGHPSIVYFFGTEQDDNFKYLAFEICWASMEQIFLPDDDPKKYVGPLPSTGLDVLCQLAKGLQYIHDKGFVHRDVKPGNVLISYSKDDGTVVMKWAGFDQSNSVSERGTFTVSGYRGTTNWIAPEILAILLGEDENSSVKTQKGTVESDTWSFGCVIFAYLTKLKHPFAGGKGILANIMNNNPINLTALPIDHFAFNIIKGMIQKEPKNRIKLYQVVEILKKLKEEIKRHNDFLKSETSKKFMQKIGRIAYDENDILGSGYYGLVFWGTFLAKDDGRLSIVAVKRISCNTDERELKALKGLKGHPNVIPLYGAEKDQSFQYFALELCAASMQDLFFPSVDAPKYKGPSLPSDLDVLLQLSKGLNYIHDQGFVHRDIKPGNVLISCPKDDGTVLMKWADFGLSKPVSSAGSFTVSDRGTPNWIAPEILLAIEAKKESKETQKGTVDSDIWSAGCVFFYYLRKGEYPLLLGDKNGDLGNLKALSIYHFAANIIREMIQKEPAYRITLANVVKILNEVKKDTSQQQQNNNAVLEAGRLYSWENWNLALKNGQLFVWSEDFTIEGISQTECPKIEKSGTKKGQLNREMFHSAGITLGTPCRSPLNTHFVSHGKKWTVRPSVLLGQLGTRPADTLIIEEERPAGDKKWEMVLFGDSFHSTIHVIKENGEKEVHMTDTAKDMKEKLVNLCSLPNPEPKDLDRISALLQVGVNPNCTNNDGQTPLLLCLANQNGKSRLETLKILLKHNQSRGEETTPKRVNMNVQDSQQMRNAFQLILDKKGGIAEDCMVYQSLELLIQGGIRINLTDEKGRTALHLLCLNYKYENIVDIIKLLVENDIDVDSKDNYGKTALDYFHEDQTMEGYKEQILEIINQGRKGKHLTGFRFFPFVSPTLFPLFFPRISGIFRFFSGILFGKAKNLKSIEKPLENIIIDNEKIDDKDLK